MNKLLQKLLMSKFAIRLYSRLPNEEFNEFMLNTITSRGEIAAHQLAPDFKRFMEIMDNAIKRQRDLWKDIDYDAALTLSQFLHPSTTVGVPIEDAQDRVKQAQGFTKREAYE